MDHLSLLIRDVFPDSKIAKSFSSVRTKTSCILNMALQPHFESALVSHMKEEPFSLAIDGSNDNDTKKMNPLTVRIFDNTNGVYTILRHVFINGMLSMLFERYEAFIAHHSIKVS